MFRIFTVVSIVLLHLAATGCIAVEKERRYACEKDACHGYCRHEFANSTTMVVYGQCDDTDLCHCYIRHPCNGSMCERLCRERLGEERNLHSNCTESQCYCSYDKRCVQSECARACEQRYPGADMLESVCTDNACTCKWQEKSAKRRSGDGETKVPYSEAKEAAEQLRGYHVFTLDEEVAPRGGKKQRKLADSGS